MADRPPSERDHAAPEREGAFVEGRLVSERGEPAAGVQIRLYQLGFGGKADLLAEATSAEDGTYRLAYASGARAPSVEVRAVGARGKELAISAAAFVPIPGEPSSS